MTPSPDPTPQDLPGHTAEEWQSAWYDRELSSENSVEVGPAGPRKPDPVRLQDYQRLSQLLRALPVEPLPADFASRVMARLPEGSSAPSSQPGSSQPDRPARFPLRRLAWLAASLAGVAVLVARWQPQGPAPGQGVAPPLSSKSAPASDGGFSGASASLAARPTLAFQLNHIPPEKLAIVRIRVPQRGTNLQATDEAMDLTERAFGEQQITQATEVERVPGVLPDLPSPPLDATQPAVAGLRTTAGPADPMLLLVVGESEAIVKGLEQLLENLEQTELEEEIQAVAQTELEQLSTDLNRSLEEYLVSLEQSWAPAEAAATDFDPGGGRPLLREEKSPPVGLQKEAPAAPSRTRGWMAWLPADSAAGSFVTSAGTSPAASLPQAAGDLSRQPAAGDSSARRIAAKRAATPTEPPARLSEERGRSQALPQVNSSPPTEADANAANPTPLAKSDSADGSRTRRVLIQIIREPAG